MYELLPHVLGRMLERGISEDELKQAWQRRMSPVVPGSGMGNVCFTGQTKTGRRLKITTSGADQKVIVTVWEV